LHHLYPQQPTAHALMTNSFAKRRINASIIGAYLNALCSGRAQQIIQPTGHKLMIDNRCT
jgi:hypothetical protein